MSAIAYGTPTHISALPVRYGVARGIFADAGLDLTVETVFGGPELSAAYDRGELWIGEIGSPPGVTAIARGARFRIVASAEKRPALMYVSLHESIQRWAQLRGRRVGALTIGSCGYWFLREILAHHGLDPDREVEIVGLGERYPQTLELIASREIDGALLVEPYVSLGEHRGIVRNWGALANLEYLPSIQWTVQVARTDAIERDPDLVRRVLDAVAIATHAAHADPAEYARFLAKHLAIPDAVAERAVAREHDALELDGTLDLPGLANLIALQTKLRAFPAGLTVDDVVDRSFGREVAATVSVAMGSLQFAARVEQRGEHDERDRFGAQDARAE
jgi:NitT/TauT family transport system substrate-binding protein